LTNIINRSLVSGTFPAQFKSCSVIPFLKKYNLDKEDLSNYSPISHLSSLSKLTECVVRNRLTSQTSTNNLLYYYQSAYTKHHSTEFTILADHHHIIKSMSEHKVTALCLLDRSAASDNIDHSILLTSYLSTLLPLHMLLFVKVFHKDQSSVILYTAPLSSVLLSRIRLSVIIYLLMTHNCSSPSGHLHSLPIFYTYTKYN